MRNEIACEQVGGRLVGGVSPVTASVAGGQRGGDVVAQLLLGDAGVGGHPHVVEDVPARRRKSSWAVGVSKSASVAPLSEPPSGKPAMPDQLAGVQRAAGVAVIRRTRSPTP